MCYRTLSGAKMPRFYFDVADGTETAIDEDGLDLPDLKTARSNALAALKKIARAELPDGDWRDFKVCIRDEARRQVLLSAHFCDLSNSLLAAVRFLRFASMASFSHWQARLTVAAVYRRNTIFSIITISRITWRA
jgi:hypothetical protein